MNYLHSSATISIRLLVLAVTHLGLPSFDKFTSCALAQWDMHMRNMNTQSYLLTVKMQSFGCLPFAILRYWHKQILITCFATVLFPVFARAQFIAVTANTAVPWPAAGHEYVKYLDETVTPANGQLSVRINLPVPTGRQLTLPFGYAYDSNGVYYPVWLPSGSKLTDEDWGQSPTVGWIQWLPSGSPSALVGGWTNTLPWAGGPVKQTVQPTVSGGQPCIYYVNWSFFDSQGGRHALKGLSTTDPSNPTNCRTSTPGAGGDEYYGGSVPAASTTASQGLVVRDTEGTTYDFTGTNWGVPAKIEDRNGNYLTLGGGPSGEMVWDTLGNPVVSVSVVNANTTTVTLSSGQSYTIQWETGSYNFNPNGVLESSATGCVLGAPSGSTTVIHSITLPNQTQYVFGYDPVTGLLNSIKYPWGALVSYVWDRNSSSTWSAFNDTAGDSNACVFHYDTPAIQSRTVSFDGVHTALTQKFTYSTSWNPTDPSLWTLKTTTVVTTDDIQGTTNTTTYTYVPGIDDSVFPAGYVYPPSLSDLFVPLESTIATQDWSGTLLQTVTKTWIDAQQIQSEQTTIPGVGTRLTTYSYPQGYRRLGEVDEYDYGATSPGSLLRKTQRQYLLSSAPYGPSWVPCKDTVSSAGALAAAETDYYYDNDESSTPCQATGNPTVTSATATQHDETNYAPASTPHFRGNLTRKVQISGAGSNPVTTYTYDETGQVTSSTDPRGYQTIYSYSDEPSRGDTHGTSNAYLTTITDPLGYTQNFTYNYNTGEMLSSIDENQEPILYYYNDSLNRLTQTNYPDQGETSICYNDTADICQNVAVPSVTTSILMNASNQWKSTVAVIDGMGHVTQTQLTTDPVSPDIVNTTYTGENQIASQSNPFRGSSESVSGTTFYYDALNRMIEKVGPDGSVQQWCYDGAQSITSLKIYCNPSRISGSLTGTWVDYTDALNNHWQRVSDALGMLRNVWEPNGSTPAAAMLTSYNYDLLNNLLSVNQTGNGGTDVPRTRNFLFNSLSQLISATNPETGTITYTYDLNGNVHAKTDARGVITTYGYDAINHLVSKSYSNDPSGTPTSCYQYGTSVATNTVERLVSEWTQSASAGTCASPTGSPWTKRTISLYDSMGRVLNEQQSTPFSIGNGTTYGPSYTYDYAGDLITSTDGSTPSPTNPGISLTFTNSFDGAGHLSTTTSNWSDSTHPSSLFAGPTTQTIPCSSSGTFQYSPFGGLWNATLGNSILLNRGFDLGMRTNCEVDTGSTVVATTPGVASAVISGVEQSK